jgi:ribosomal protein S18 acetylase RimI-like enzyme
MPDDVTDLPAPRDADGTARRPGDERQDVTAPDARLVVRPARVTELAAAGEVVAAAYLNDLRVSPWYADRLRDTATRADQAMLLVAVDIDHDEAVLGSLTFARGGTRYAQLAADDECEIRMLGVRPDARGRGIGELLVRAAMARGAADGAVRMVLSTQTEMKAAQRLYERLGFTRRPDLDWVPEQDSSVQLIAYERDLP